MYMLSFKFHGHACVEIVSDGLRMITDPWFGTPFHFNSLVAYPPIATPSEENLSQINLIHISHIHRDHFDQDSLKKFSKNVPVLISDYKNKFFRDRIRGLGFQTIIEVPEEGITFAGCQFHSVQIEPFNGSYDSLLIMILENRKVLLNNDCILTLDQYQKLKQKFGRIDYGFVGYCSVSPFPFCYTIQNISADELHQEAKDKAISHVKMLNEIFQFSKIIPYANGIRCCSPKQKEVNSYFETWPYFSKYPELSSKLYYCEPGQYWSDNFEVGTNTYFQRSHQIYFNDIANSNAYEFSKEEKFDKDVYLNFFRSYFRSVESRINPDWQIVIALKPANPGQEMLFLYHQKLVCESIDLQKYDIKIEFEVPWLNEVILKKASLASVFYAFQFRAHYNFLPTTRNQKVHSWFP